MKTDQVFLSLGQQISHFFPRLERQLRTARIDDSPSEYLASALKKSLTLGGSSSMALIVAGIATQAQSTTLIGLIAFPVLTLMGFLTFEKSPSIKTKRRTRELEKDLPYALRDILIEIKSGISLYNAFKSVTNGYGEASSEFEIMVREVEGGESMVDAIENSIVRNPSEQYRRAMWQVNNSIKSGTNVADTLENVVDSIVKDQKLRIEKYGKEMNPYVLGYLLIAVVMPSLGITALIVLSSFTGTSVTRNLYLGILAGLVIAQVFFLNLIRSKRPEVKA